ncbi:hypothetical protein L7F22_000838 [Adiantum nelumboides]|nr:hypothetical protein [Adiantum nelumboides]
MQQDGIPGTMLTFVSSLKACGGMGNVEAGQEVHASIVKQGLEKDRPVGNILVDMYARCGSIAEAEDVFKRLDSRDVISWTALIQGYADKDMGYKALKHFELMEEEDICPDVVAFSFVLQACTSIRDRERGQLMHTDMVKRGHEGDTLAVNALMDMYAKLDLYDEAWTVFSLVLNRVGMWNTPIQGYAEQGRGEEALAFLEQMQLEGLSPDVFTWNTVMAGLIEKDNAERVLELYAQMHEQCVSPNDFTLMNVMASCGNTSTIRYGRRFHAQVVRSNSSIATENLAVSLIDMYGKCGSMVDAHEVFNATAKRGTATWNALLAGYTRQGNNKLVFKHYACTFDLLGRAGRLNEIVTLMQEMPFQPNLVTWNTFIGACQRFGNLDLGRQAFEFARSLVKKHGGSYVFMSNIYVDVDSEV